jgi:hypothetical protein
MRIKIQMLLTIRQIELPGKLNLKLISLKEYSPPLSPKQAPSTNVGLESTQIISGVTKA